MISSGFTLDSSSTCPQLTAGSAATSLASGTSCSLLVDYSPTTATSVSGTVSIANNNLNASAVQTVQLTGGAGQTVATTTTINVNTPTYGETQVSATILGTSGTLAPVGSVVFTVDGTVQAAIPLDNTGVATLPAPVANALAVGSHTIGGGLHQHFARLRQQRCDSNFLREPGATYGLDCIERSLAHRRCWFFCHRYTYVHFNGRVCRIVAICL